MFCCLASSTIIFSGLFAFASSACYENRCQNGGTCIRVNLTDFSDNLPQDDVPREKRANGENEDFICECTGGYSGRTCTDLFETCELPVSWQDKEWNVIHIGLSSQGTGQCTAPMNVYRTVLYSVFRFYSSGLTISSWSCHLNEGNIYILRGQSTANVEEDINYVYIGLDTGVNSQLVDDCTIPIYYIITERNRFNEPIVMADYLVTNISSVVNQQLPQDGYNILLNRGKDFAIFIHSRKYLIPKHKLDSLPDIESDDSELTTPNTSTSSTTSVTITTTTSQTTTTAGENRSSLTKQLHWALKTFLIISILLCLKRSDTVC